MLMDRHIRDKILTVKSLHSDQHAYRVGRPTETAMSKAVNLIENQLNLNDFAIETFMDSRVPSIVHLVKWSRRLWADKESP